MIRYAPPRAPWRPGHRNSGQPLAFGQQIFEAGGLARGDFAGVLLAGDARCHGAGQQDREQHSGRAQAAGAGMAPCRFLGRGHGSLTSSPQAEGQADEQHDREDAEAKRRQYPTDRLGPGRVAEQVEPGETGPRGDREDSAEGAEQQAPGHPGQGMEHARVHEPILYQ